MSEKFELQGVEGGGGGVGRLVHIIEIQLSFLLLHIHHFSVFLCV